jgi:hypothetical protein
MLSIALLSAVESSTGSGGASAFFPGGPLPTALSACRWTRAMIGADAFAGSISELSPVRSITREFVDFVSQSDLLIGAGCRCHAADLRFGRREVNKSRPPLSTIYRLSHDHPAIPKGDSGVPSENLVPFHTFLSDAPAA